MVSMLSAQSRFHSRSYKRGQSYRASGGAGAYSQPARDTLADAYQALGLRSDVGDDSLKRAYRKLMSENHPDKLMSKGVPDEMIKLATARSQEISTAYQVIREARGLK